MDLLAADRLFESLVTLVLLAVCAWALVDAVVRPAPAFPAAGKLTKPAWVLILVVATLAAFRSGAFGLLGLVAAVAAIVYLVDVRPAVRAMRPGGPWA